MYIPTNDLHGKYIQYIIYILLEKLQRMYFRYLTGQRLSTSFSFDNFWWYRIYHFLYDYIIVKERTIILQYKSLHTIFIAYLLSDLLKLKKGYETYSIYFI